MCLLTNGIKSIKKKLLSALVIPPITVKDILEGPAFVATNNATNTIEYFIMAKEKY